MSEDLERAKKRHQREKAARLQAEEILEIKSRELFEKNQALQKLSESLESQVASRTQDLIAARDEALSAVRTKSEFLANMSHELRTPMNGVLGMLTLLQGTNLDDQQQDYLQVSKNSGELLLSVINDILDFSKIEAGKMDLESLVFEPRVLIRDVVAPLRFVAEEKGLELNVKVDSSIPSVIWGDPTRLKQIINNLLSNAIKFTEQGVVQIHVLADAEYYQIRIKDSGLGMSEHHVSKIFEAFGQADSSITRTHGGTGLGLTITSSLVRMMKGDIQVESKLGAGSTFSVILPLKKANDDELNSLNEIKHGLFFSREPILLVEDNLVNQRVALYLLEEANLNVTCANNGLEALKLLEDNNFSLILMDLQMPVMDGIEATKKIRMFDSPIKDIPIIAMTAHASVEHIQECLEIGMNAHTTKPIDVDVLLSTISNWIKPSEIKSDKAVDEKNNTDFNVQGVNVEEGLNRIRGNLDLYKKLLSTFYNENVNASNVLNMHLELGEFDDLKSRFHTIKGSAANISADSISTFAGRLEALSGKNDLLNIKQQLSQFNEELSALCQSIKQAVDEFSGEKNLESLEFISDEEWRSKLKAIEANIYKDFSVSDELIKSLFKYELTEEQNRLVKQLDELSDRFDMTGLENAIKESKWW